MTITLHYFYHNENSRAHKILAVAALANIPIIRSHVNIADPIETPPALRESFLLNCSPTGGTPVMEIPEGYIFESNAIMRHLARLAEYSQVYGGGGGGGNSDGEEGDHGASGGEEGEEGGDKKKNKKEKKRKAKANEGDKDAVISPPSTADAGADASPLSPSATLATPDVDAEEVVAASAASSSPAPPAADTSPTAANTTAAAATGKSKRAHLYGRTLFENSSVDSWIDLCATQFEPLIARIYNNAFKQVPLAPTFVADSDAVFAAIERWLENKTYLVGERITIADVAVAFSLKPFYRLLSSSSSADSNIPLSQRFKSKYPSVWRLYNIVMQQPEVVDVLTSVESGYELVI